MPAATVTLHEMTPLLEHLPRYDTYGSRGRAVDHEREFRRSLGLVLRQCGNHLLEVAEQRSQILSQDQEEIIDLLVDHLSSIFRRLDREGHVAIAGDPDQTVHELHELDGQLLQLSEDALRLARDLDLGAPSEAWFRDQAIRLSQDLADLSRATEERNYLLGLGWESEFARLRQGGRP
ncbi:MAG: hypothetical protein R3D98_01290 [Candidatus Krumholzibacteriia bacterium]